MNEDFSNDHDEACCPLISGPSSLTSSYFFTISEKSPNALKAIVKEMQKQFKENDVQDFLNWHGQPVWSEIIKFEKR